MLRPSEAIRRGRSQVPNWTAGLFSFLRPKATEGQMGSQLYGDNSIRGRDVYAACTLGAMAVGYVGVEGVVQDRIFDGSFYWPSKFGGLEGAPELPIPCSHGENHEDALNLFADVRETEDGFTARVTDIIAHLNDEHSPLAVGAKELPEPERVRRGLSFFKPKTENRSDVWSENKVVRWLEANGL